MNECGFPTDYSTRGRKCKDTTSVVPSLWSSGYCGYHRDLAEKSAESRVAYEMSEADHG